MIYQHATKLERLRRTAVRHGRIGPLLLAVMTVTFLCGIVIINSYFATQMRVQQENATDSAALAAAEVLAQEDLLYGDPSIFGLTLPQTSPAASANNPLFGVSTQAALQFAARNYVGGKPFAVQPQDVVFSVTDVQARTSLALMPAAAANPPVAPPAAPLSLAQMRTINAVQVNGRSTQARGNALRWPIFDRSSWEIANRSQAVLDGYVYGFHTDPAGQINIPLAPIGLNAQRWSAHVEGLVDPSRTVPANGILPFRDFKVILGASAQAPDLHDSSKIAPMLQLGTTTLTEAAAQFNPANPGITPAQYGLFFQANNSQPFALDPTTLQLPLPTLPNAGDADFAALQANLTGLQTNGTRLIWPLVSGYNNATPAQAIIVGFVAARVVGVERVSDRLGTNRNSNDLLELTLHPTLLATSTAVVFVRDWPANAPFRFPNAYVKKIRLIQ